MELNNVYGSKITAEIKQGRKMHEELESETNPVPVVLVPKSYADVMYKILYTSASALDVLQENKISREIQIYGSIGGFTVVGKMDQLQIKDGEVFIWEDKTKSNDNIPTEPQMLSHKVQVMLYRKLLIDIVTKKYTIDMYRRKYGIVTLRVSEEFARQLDTLSIPKPMQSVDAMAIRYFDNIAKLGKISEQLHIKYINQFTGKEIALHKFNYNEDEMNKELDFVMKYWKGEREAMPVPMGEKWKCGYCVFFGKECKVWWPQQKLAL
jgi:exonuclease V